MKDGKLSALLLNCVPNERWVIEVRQWGILARSIKEKKESGVIDFVETTITEDGANFLILCPFGILYKAKHQKQILLADQTLKKKRDDIQELKAIATNTNIINLVDIEKHMYMAISLDPEILICTSGENCLSNFLLWQSAYSHLYSTLVLWPEISFSHLVWAVLNFQHNHSYLEKKKKLL